MLLAAPLDPLWLTVMLAVLGLGLGIFTPANNALIMGAIPVSSSGTGGGLVNMARGLGTALGVALVTLALHLAPQQGQITGPRWAACVLLLVSLVTMAAAWSGPRAQPAEHHAQLEL